MRDCRAEGIIIADTKLEFGIYNGEVILIDEVLTPDSSRFWPKSGYTGKELCRKALTSSSSGTICSRSQWNQKPPAPVLPDDVVRKTSEKYLEVLGHAGGLTVYS